MTAACFTLIAWSPVTVCRPKSTTAVATTMNSHAREQQQSSSSNRQDGRVLISASGRATVACVYWDLGSRSWVLGRGPRQCATTPDSTRLGSARSIRTKSEGRDGDIN
ncbi:hypothetical protein F5Y03DRAFT_347315 [Xylaria venustula]|nr:hypothetical protein F5Y03DRAFT_347315 [Xylaria venustula]